MSAAMALTIECDEPPSSTLILTCRAVAGPLVPAAVAAVAAVVRSVSFAFIPVDMGVGVRKSGVRVQGGSWHNVLSWLRCRTISAGIRSDDGVRHSSRSRVPCCAAERKMPLLTSLLVYETGVRHAECGCCFVEREHAAWALVDGARTLKRPQPGERGDETSPLLSTA